MLKLLSASAAFATCIVVAALAEPQASPPAAQAQPQNLPSVDTMTCDQMQAEMMLAGQQMHNQLDPQFGVEAQAMQQEAQQKQREAMQQAAPNPVCFIPYMAMACAAQQQQQAQQSQAEAAANQQRIQAQMDRLNASMAGLDQQRLMAIGNRYQAQHCQSPQGPQSH